MAREKEQRAWIREVEKRLIIENRNKKSNLEAAIRNGKKIAMTLFALGPELCIAVLSPLIVLLFGAGCGVPRDEKQIEQNEPEQRERIVYVPNQVSFHFQANKKSLICDCPKLQTDLFHFRDCRAEPPWGCNCVFCVDSYGL